MIDILGNNRNNHIFGQQINYHELWALSEFVFRISGHWVNLWIRSEIFSTFLIMDIDK